MLLTQIGYKHWNQLNNSYHQVIILFSTITFTSVLTVFGQNSLQNKTESFAVKALRTKVGDEAFAELLSRLHKTNSDIKLKGIKTIDGKPDAGGSFLTGYPYTDLYSIW
jgi:hypothetical protein